MRNPCLRIAIEAVPPEYGIWIFLTTRGGSEMRFMRFSKDSLLVRFAALALVGALGLFGVIASPGEANAGKFVYSVKFNCQLKPQLKLNLVVILVRLPKIALSTSTIPTTRQSGSIKRLSWRSGTPNMANSRMITRARTSRSYLANNFCRTTPSLWIALRF